MRQLHSLASGHEPDGKMNKNLTPNLVALAVVVASQLFNEPVKSLLFSTGLFALSGALTNWLAIHMLFERVPGLYGSGVVVLHFEKFKAGIQRLVKEQLFSAEKVEQVLKQPDHNTSIDLQPVLAKLDLDAAFDQLIATVMESSFGSMLSMVGGEAAPQPMRKPFNRRLQKFLTDAASSPKFQTAVNEQVSQFASSEQFITRLETILQARLDELTPEMVRDIMQQMIRQHLGWLVVWGAVFGGLIGLSAGLLQLYG